ncbi:hypothetical protein F5884DRAFT_898471 [Xylogone sp. PMI_703]|nr:hypothetical protein F5884DRAFT_898471 [Xylogone sp. PMI_703]
MQVDWSSMQQLFNELGLERASQKVVQEFYDAINNWRDSYVTRSNQPATTLMKWEDPQVYEELQNMAGRFVDDEKERNDLRFWSPGRSWARSHDLSYPEDREKIVKLLTEIFWRRNLLPLHSKRRPCQEVVPNSPVLANIPVEAISPPTSPFSRPTTSSSQISNYTPSLAGDTYDDPSEPANVSDKHDGQEISRKMLVVPVPPGFSQGLISRSYINANGNSRILETGGASEMMTSITEASEQDITFRTSEAQPSRISVTSIAETSFQFQQPSTPLMIQQANQVNKKPQRKTTTGTKRVGRPHKATNNAQQSQAAQSEPRVLSSNMLPTNEANVTPLEVGSITQALPTLESISQSQSSVPSHSSALLPVPLTAGIAANELNIRLPPQASQSWTVPELSTITPATQAAMISQVISTACFTSPTSDHASSPTLNQSEAISAIEQLAPAATPSIAGNPAKETVQVVRDTIPKQSGKDTAARAAAALVLVPESMLRSLIDKSADKNMNVMGYIEQVLMRRDNAEVLAPEATLTVEKSASDRPSEKSPNCTHTSEDRVITASTPAPDSTHLGQEPPERLDNSDGNTSSPVPPEDTSPAQRTREQIAVTPNVSASSSARPQPKGSLVLFIVTHHPRYEIIHWEDGIKFINSTTTITDIIGSIARLKQVPQDQITKVNISLDSPVYSAKFGTTSGDTAWVTKKRVVMNGLRQMMELGASGTIFFEPVFERRSSELNSSDDDVEDNSDLIDHFGTH